MKKRIILSLAIFLTTFLLTKAQDIFFSQFYASHLALNPALTGFTLGDMQVSTIYRAQQNSLIPGYTYAASADYKITRENFSPDILAVGGMVINDHLNAGEQNSLNILTSGAYHKAIGPDNNHYAAMGIQLGMLQRKFDPTVHSYHSQWVDHQYDPDASINENFTKEQAFNFDMNLGFLWYSKINELTALYAGGSAYHLHQPKQSLFGDDARFSRRFIVHGGGRIGLSEEFALVPNVIYMTQNKSKQLVSGLNFEYYIEDASNALRFGTWFRTSDNNLIFSAGFRVQNFQFGISSDFISPVQNVSQTQGALEFSLVYSPFFKQSTKLEADPTRTF